MLKCPLSIEYKRKKKGTEKEKFKELKRTQINVKKKQKEVEENIIAFFIGIN